LTTTQTFTVQVNGDTTDEPDETYFIQLFGATGAGIADGLGVGTIVNDDPPPTVSIGNASMLEGNSGVTYVILPVQLSAPSGKVVAVDFATADGTAVAPGDYQPVSGTVVFSPGETLKNVAVIINSDTLGEANETFLVNLSNPIDATIADGQGVATILNDDPTPALLDRSVTPVVTEGSVATLRGTISLVNPQDQFILEVEWGDGTPTQVLKFPAGSNGQMVQVDHTYADNAGGAGTYTVHAVWHNQFGGGNVADFAVQVNNVPPVVDAGGDAVLHEGGVLDRKGSFTDPGADTWTITVDYGDGSGPQTIAVGPDRTFHLHHKYQEEGNYAVTVTVRDDDGGVGIDQFVVHYDDHG
jgi:hypothetical protein